MTVFGIDYDGTIVDTNFMKSKWIKESLGLNVPPWKCSRTECIPIIGRSNYERLSNIVYEKEWSLKAPPINGALNGLKELKKIGTVYIITVRSKPQIRWAEKWLEKHNVMKLIHEIISASKKSKTEICLKYSINILLDDDERHLQTTSKKCLVKVLIKDDGPPIWHQSNDIVYVTCWKEFITLIRSFEPKDRAV